MYQYMFYIFKKKIFFGEQNHSVINSACHGYFVAGALQVNKPEILRVQQTTELAPRRLFQTYTWECGANSGRAYSAAVRISKQLRNKI